MSAVERLDEIEARMNREVPALDLRDRSDLRFTLAALRAVLAECVQDGSSLIVDDGLGGDCHVVEADLVRGAIEAVLDGES